jgi:hypothetical protein
MSKQINVKVSILALALLSVSGLAQAQFSKGMDQANLATEIRLQLLSGLSLNLIAKSAKTSGLDSVQVTEALIQAGVYPAAVVKAVARENPKAAGSILAAALKLVSPEQRKEIITAMLTVPGVNPTTVLEATASGPQSEDRDHQESTKLSVPTETPHSGGGHHNSASPS